MVRFVYFDSESRQRTSRQLMSVGFGALDTFSLYLGAPRLYIHTYTHRIICLNYV